MAAITKSEASQMWTVRSLVVEKEEVRRQWEAELTSTIDKVAIVIGESILPEIFTKMHEWLSNPYRTHRESLHLKFSLALPQNAVQVKAWMKETANLPPFNQWLPEFTKANQKKQIEDEDLSVSFSKDGYGTQVDTAYFQSLMSAVGKEVAEHIERKIGEFIAEPDNALLQSRVEWCRSGGGKLSFSMAESNTICVSLGLKAADPAEEAAGGTSKRAGWGSWLGW